MWQNAVLRLVCVSVWSVGCNIADLMICYVSLLWLVSASASRHHSALLSSGTQPTQSYTSLLEWPDTWNTGTPQCTIMKRFTTSYISKPDWQIEYTRLKPLSLYYFRNFKGFLFTLLYRNMRSFIRCKMGIGVCWITQSTWECNTQNGTFVKRSS